MENGWPLEVGRVGLLLPMGLHQNTIDIVGMTSFCRGSNSLDQGATDTEVAGLAHAIGGTNDRVDRGHREGVVSQANAIQFRAG